MGYELKLMEEDSILLTVFDSSFDVGGDGQKLMSEMKHYLDNASSPLYMLDDFLNMKMSFGDLVSALSMATRGDIAIMKHPNVRKLVIVSTNELLRLGGSALKQAQYGGLQADIYPSVDEAIAAIRKERAAARA